MKKVLYISYDGMTDPLGQSQVLPYLSELTKQGYQFTVLSVEKPARFKMHSKLIRQLMQESGIKWVTLPFSTRPPYFSKMIDQWRLNRKAEALQRENDYQLVHCRSYVAAESGMKLSRKYQIPFLFDMRGFWVDERVDSGLWDLKKPLYKYFYKVYKKKEKAYFDAADHIISLTNKGKEELLASYGVSPGKVTVIPCCADLDHFNYEQFSPALIAATRQDLGIKAGARVLSYLGSLGGWYMSAEMFSFYSALRKKLPSSVFLVVTHDPEHAIKAMAESMGIPRDEIIVVAASRNDVPRFLSVSDWNIFFIKDVYSKKASSPTKQGEVMAMGIPILCNDIGDTGAIISDTGAGILVNNFSALDLDNAADRLIQLNIAKSIIRKGAFRYYDLHYGAELYRQVYKSMIN